MENPFHHFSQALHTNAKASKRSIVVAGALGTIIFGAYGLLWLYVTPLAHESLGLRVFGMLACLGLWSSPHWPARCQKCLPWLWFATLCYALPFFSTYQLLTSNYSVLRSMIEVATVFLIIGLFPNYMLASVNMALGLVFGTLAAYIMLPDFWALNHTIVKSVHIPALLYSIVAGMILTRSHLKSQLAQEKVEAMKVLIGSIAHEMKSPMGQLSQRMDTIGRLLPGHVVGAREQIIPVRDLEVIYTEIARCKDAIERGNQVIEMTMDEISSKPVNRSGLRYLAATTVTRKALEEYSYQSCGEKARITLEMKDDFVFKGNETRFVFLLFNLLRNATYYFDQYPESLVTVTIGKHTVTVEDTGPGIAPEVLLRVFEAFHSEGKEGGTGLGLAFCKRTMLAFGGDITCESVPSKFTRFVMTFPPLGQDEFAIHEKDLRALAVETFTGKRILVVDDIKNIRTSIKKRLEELNALVDEADDGRQALRMLATRRYDAMVLDLCMPELDGYATAERVRGGAIPGLEHLAIVVHSAEARHAARVRLERIGVDTFISKGCTELDLIDALCRAHASASLKAKAIAARAKLAGKTILLADDEAFNRSYLRAMLREQGFQVLEASNGQIALNLLNDSSAQIDAVVTDINMPGLNGLEMVRMLRSRPLPRGTIPVIALSAHSDETTISAAREAGVSDFLVKPVDPLDLIRALNVQLRGQQAGAMASPTSPAGRSLLDLAWLDSLRRVGLIKEDLARALDEIGAKLEKLAGHLAANDLTQAKALMHALLGLTGQLGAKAIYEEVHAKYALMMETEQWPADQDWLPKLRQLFADTDRVLRAQTKR